MQLTALQKISISPEEQQPCLLNFTVLVDDSIAAINYRTDNVLIVDPSGYVENGAFASRYLKKPWKITSFTNGLLSCYDDDQQRIKVLSRCGELISSVPSAYTSDMATLDEYKLVCCHPGPEDCCLRVYDVRKPQDVLCTARYCPLSRENLFAFPGAVAVTAQKHLVVADRIHHNITMLSAECQLISRLGKKGSGRSELNYPHSVCCHGSKVIIADWCNHRLQLVSSDGHFSVFTLPDGQRKQDPTCVKVDASGCLLVAFLRGTISKFILE